MSWATILAHAIKKKKFSCTAKAKAREWPQCAIGENLEKLGLTDSIDLNGDLEGRYPPLFRLGMDFNDAVATDDVKSAESLYKSINDRIRNVFGA